MTYKYKKYIEENEEIRYWFKVSANRKKLWNIQLGLIEEVKKICKKHGLKYYADSWTLLWAVRHKWFIPWDDDVDLVMFRDDYDKFREIAPKELPSHVKLCKFYCWISEIVNTNTAALWYKNWWDKDFVGWIWIDIFPLDYASKFMIINHIKSIILRFLWMILISQKSDKLIEKITGYKKFILKISKIIFRRINSLKIHNIYEKVSRKYFFKWNNVYSCYCPYHFLSKNIYDDSFNEYFENIVVNIPSWYDELLKSRYDDYMTPVIYEWWHHCLYSVDKSYKDIIKSFDITKSNEENYNNSKDLFSI